jgi:eukaryotic-like serine/threonine-protein kinase
MLTESEKRAVTVAVSRYGANQALVQQAVAAVLEAHAQGRSADLLEVLVVKRQLTQAQADEVRAALDSTHFDLATPVTPAPGKRAETRLPARTTANGRPLMPGESTPDLRALGEYRLLRRLGEGGMSSVYLGYQESTGQQVAVKVLPEHLALNQPSLDRFYREAKSGALLNHPNIVRNLTAGQDQASGVHYLVLEYVDGPSAQALLNRFGRLSVGDAVHIVLDIARALEHAHSRRVVHRDIKPDNILLTLSGVAKLADLGLAKRTDETSHLTAARQGFGTPYYMPYEQAMNARSADGRSDIYALGATLYHLLTGEVPFPGVNHLEIIDKKHLGTFEPASRINPNVPTVLDRILRRMLARDPIDRYQTASELIVDLERADLAAPVLSFVDEDLALKDPLVRARLTAPAQATCPDLRGHVADAKAKPRAGDPDLWYLKYRDHRGQWCKARATTQQVVHRLRDGRMPAEVEASHEPHGSFRPLRSFPEFQQAIAANGVSKAKRRKRQDGDKPPTSPGRPEAVAASLFVSWTQRRWVALGTGLAALVLLLILFWALLA